MQRILSKFTIFGIKLSGESYFFCLMKISENCGGVSKVHLDLHCRGGVGEGVKKHYRG